MTASLREQAQCLKKKPYASFEAARWKADYIARREKIGMRAYECPWCGKWHITSQVPIPSPKPAKRGKWAKWGRLWRESRGIS